MGTKRRPRAMLIRRMPNLDRDGERLFNSRNMAYLVAVILIALMYLYTRGYF
jgi:hypothetical protein